MLGEGRGHGSSCSGESYSASAAHFAREIRACRGKTLASFGITTRSESLDLPEMAHSLAILRYSERVLSRRTVDATLS